MDYKDLTPDQRERLNECKTPEEVLALAQEEGVELTSEQLEQVAGGRSRSIAGANPWKKL